MVELAALDCGAVCTESPEEEEMVARKFLTHKELADVIDDCVTGSNPAIEGEH